MENEINEKLLKPYDPANTEDRIYKLWEEGGYFNPDTCIEKGFANEENGYFSIMLPPPNVTGTLHIGHAFEDTLQDILVRFNRMQGKVTLWLPGTDHAAIATQSKVEKIIEKEESKRKNDLGREEFLNRVNLFAKESQDTIINQIKKMGASLDWSREAFTLDEKRHIAVNTAFKKMYDEGLIYRGHKIVNWDPKGQTVISDDEVTHEERKGILYTFKYSADFPISISTTRPETKLGDTAVAVNPSDERYKKYIGQIFTIENFCGEKLEIKIVGDESVEKDFGTGALGVTPAHSQIDADIAIRNDLPIKQVINEFAKMTVGMPGIMGEKTTVARDAIVAWLKEQNLLEKEEEIIQNISIAERSGGIIEPLPKLQWFIDVNKKIPSRDNKSLKELILQPVKDRRIKILPERFEKVYYHWIENLRDWCISRQIWYGHRIPVWYKGEEIHCGEKPDGDAWTQDEDTLDTWFSSGLWTFSTLGWPENTEDLKRFHPTSIIMPGYEILFFWVARMILMSQYLLGEIPFQTVYLHGIVRDKKGQKFSKSLNNGIDPLDMINEFGTDALRMSFVVGAGPGNDVKFDTQKVKAYKHFANKLWNITRFIESNTQGINFDSKFSDFVDTDKELVKEHEEVLEDITKEMQEYKFYLAGEKIYHYTWSRLADIIIEESKEILQSKNNTPEKISRAQFLQKTLRNIITVLHPFMPFVTEELWSILHNNNPQNLLIVEKWPR